MARHPKDEVRAASGIRLDRRQALKGASQILTLAALPASSAAWAQDQSAAPVDHAPSGAQSAAEIPVSDLMKRFGGYIAGAKDQPLPPKVLEWTKWAILDALGAIVSGSQLPGGQAAIRFSHAMGGRADCTVIGDRTANDPITAALANGTMGHSDETDDVLVGPWHPGCNVIPAALAIGEKFDIAGDHFARAVAVGYDIGSRVMQASGVKMNFRAPTNSMGGTWGAGAAAICAAGLNEEETRWALSYTAQQTSGIDNFRRDPQHIEKGFMNGGMGARSGVTAALLVKSGFNAVSDCMAGEVSFFSYYRDTAQPELLIRALGEDFYITKTFFKHWPCGGPISAPLDALRALLKRHPVKSSQIRDIVVSYWSPGTITDNAGPPDVNVQHAVALMLADGKLTFKNIHDYSRFKDPEVIRLRSLIRIVRRAQGDAHQLQLVPPNGEKLDPATINMPAIQITLADGTKLAQDPVPSGPGTEEDPYTREWMVAKARSLMTPVLGADQAAKVIDFVVTIEKQSSIRKLGQLLRTDGGGAPRLSEWPMG